MWHRFSRSLERSWSTRARHRIHVDDDLAARELSLAVSDHLPPGAVAGKTVTVLCIGTDRSTGDALGPLVGSRLARYLPPGVELLGTLDKSVHAANLHDVLQRMQQEEVGGRFVIAVDACLGRSESVGYMSVKHGPLHPGTGVNKTLPAVGDCHVMGVVNVGGFMEYFVLQNTRLSLVMRMADTIADGLSMALHRVRTVQEAAVSRPDRGE